MASSWSVEEFCRELRRVGIRVAPQTVRGHLREMCRKGVIPRDLDVCRRLKL
ncbi:MAG: hypothetical protein QW230_03040 [Thermofilum sp.]